jgi:WD40 repeat protein
MVMGFFKLQHFINSLDLTLCLIDHLNFLLFFSLGNLLASGSLDKTLKLWDLAGRCRSRCRMNFTGHKDFVLSVAFTPDGGNWLISGSKDRNVQFWDPRTAVTHMILQGHKNSGWFFFFLFFCFLKKNLYSLNL